jgi:PHD/YefM family antitoxin component YafN of YafNO toxin-antitoxin module
MTTPRPLVIFTSDTFGIFGVLGFDFILSIIKQNNVLWEVTVTIFATVSDLRDTAKFSQTVKNSTEPIHVMRGANREMVVLSNAQFEAIQQQLLQLDFEAKVNEGLADITAGRTTLASDVYSNMRTKYGL